MSRFHLRASVFGRLLKFFRALLGRQARVALEMTDDDARTPAEELELLRTLCMVWPDGPYAQRFYRARTVDHALVPLAAREVRMAIEASVIHDCELCQDHVAMLRRIEARFASLSPEYPSARSGFLMAVLAKARPLIRSIRAILPLRPRPD